VEGKPVIVEVLSPTLESEGIRAGQEIVSIDGVPALEFAQREIEPYVSASTPQDLQRRVYSSLLSGVQHEAIRLILRDAGGKLLDRTVTRQGYNDVRVPPLMEWRMLDGDIAYVALNSFADAKIVVQWREAFPSLAKAKGLVLDLRSNGGGNSGHGWSILADLIDRDVRVGQMRTRLYLPAVRAWGKTLEWHMIATGNIEPSAERRYRGPAAVLLGPATYSAAEDFLVVFREAKRGKLVGQASGGSTGQPLFIDLPGGGGAAICSKQDRYADGTPWVGIGIQPDVPVSAATLEELRAGKDRALEAAAEWLRAAAAQ
jgi:C-terminal processing protease CtpA/Prc